jgi:uncharacterized membrane protein
MRRLLAFFTISVLAVACSRQRGNEPAALSTFTNRVWTVVESAGGPGDLYIFLSEGTFIRASEGGGPDIGKWSWDGKQLTVLWDTMPYTADIDSLTDSYFKLTFHLVSRSFDVALVPAIPSMPDTTHTAEFEPTEAVVNASGQNPAWLFSVKNDRASFRTAQYGTLNYDGEWAAEEPNAWEWDGHRQTPTGVERVTLDLRQEGCTPYPGVEVPFSAALDRGEESWRGCAVTGPLPKIARPDSTK